MEYYKINLLNSELIEVPFSIFDFKMTYEIWSEYITPWEHRRIFRDFKLIYNIGNNINENSYLNYKKAEYEIKQFKLLYNARKNITLAKIIQKSEEDVCFDIIEIILKKISSISSIR